ncbi:MAG: hypothetical protein O3A21_06745 [Proteobacteria bacterium]|nr:hypothetical protein [Pseudomonadota bacterium]
MTSAHRGLAANTERESRLVSFIHRITAQRACLNLAHHLVRDIPGPVLELGLGNGRTYDHLRLLFPERHIFVFERQIAAHPDCIPDDEHTILGDFRETVPNALARIGAPAAFIHGDFGSASQEKTAALAAWLGPQLIHLAAPGAIVATDQYLETRGLKQMPPPPGVGKDRYFMYRVES